MRPSRHARVSASPLVVWSFWSRGIGRTKMGKWMDRAACIVGQNAIRADGKSEALRDDQNDQTTKVSREADNRGVVVGDVVIQVDGDGHQISHVPVIIVALAPTMYDCRPAVLLATVPPIWTFQRHIRRVDGASQNTDQKNAFFTGGTR